MQVGEAKQLVIDLVRRDLTATPGLVEFDPTSPDTDAGKFMLDGRPARAIHHFSGWNLPINLAWFSGGFGLPEISGGPFHWYVFALPRRGQMGGDHYFICDYLQMREWVLDFAAPLGRDHRDHRMWRADLRVFPDDPAERSGYFRWGDEPVGSTALPGRVIEIDNVATLAERTLTTQHVGVSAPVASPRLIGV